ncbi:MAG: hypothetical protein OXI05_01570 [Bacteroidota bacterium]|nr:hypothetical protein [Bacteroidota bacterium]
MKIQERLTELSTTRRGKRILRIARISFTIGIVLFMVWQLREYDFRSVFQALPRNPGFYVLLVVLYFLLPTIQFLAYRVVWDFRPGPAIRAFIKKRILNRDVLGYSGEVYIFAWARDHVAMSNRSLMECIRDMNIISAVASTLTAVLLLAFFALEGQVNVRDLIGETQAAVLIGGIGGTLLILLVLVFTRRKWLFSMPWKETRIVFGLHVARVLVRQVLEITMWHLAMPEVPLETWFTYAAASIVVYRLPFIPNQDLVVAGVAVGIAGALTVSEPHIAALFVAVALVNRLINLLFFTTLSVQMPKEAIPVTK